MEGLKIDAYYKGLLALGVAITGGGLAVGMSAIAVTGIGISLTGIGEWMMIRKVTQPFDGGLGRASGVYYQIQRHPDLRSNIVVGLGVVLALIGIVRALF